MPVELYLTLSPAEFSIRDNYSLKYIPYPCGTVFFTLFPAEFSIRDNYSLKYIPYPCGTVFDSLLSGVFSVGKITIENTFLILVELYLTHSPVEVFLNNR